MIHVEEPKLFVPDPVPTWEKFPLFLIQEPNTDPDPDHI
jgi:hypothetical protein